LGWSGVVDGWGPPIYGSQVQPIVRLSLYLAAMAVGSSAAARFGKPTAIVAPHAPARSVELLDLAHCPAGTLHDGNVCVPVPEEESSEGEALVAERNVHRTRSGNWTEYEQIPRHPDRPRDYNAYRYPVEPLPGQSLMMSGYDLNLPNESQRRGSRLKAVGHGGIDLAQHRGAEVRLVALEHQRGPAEVLHVGWLFGNTVVTIHSVQEAGLLRQYLVLFGHLEKPATGLDAGALVDDDGLIGFVGDSDSPGAIHLHLEIRQVRDGVDARLLAPGEIVDNARTVACDPRNLLPLKPAN
jgi:murein DD-endopeptidase MepM/ murein hydrolase activator NlpD